MRVISKKLRPGRRGPVIPSLIAAIAVLAAPVLSSPLAAQNASDRFGAWRMQSAAPPPASNVMTYEPYGNGGMRVMVEATNARGQGPKWGYVTLFDGEFRSVEGQVGSATAVEFMNERTTRITNRRAGRVTQVIINTLSEDGNVIENEYVRMDADRKIVGVGHAVYVRIRQAGPGTVSRPWALAGQRNRSP